MFLIDVVVYMLVDVFEERLAIVFVISLFRLNMS